MQYVRFAVPPAAAQALAEARGARISIEHPRYQHNVELLPETQRELACDLR